MEYQNYIQQLTKDVAKLQKQYKMFEDLKGSIHSLKEAASTDPVAAKKYEKVIALQKDKKFIDTINEVKKMIKTVNKQLEVFTKESSGRSIKNLQSEQGLTQESKSRGQTPTKHKFI